MSTPSGAERAEVIRDRYRKVFGAVPPGIDERIGLAQAAGRLDAVETIEELRRVLIAELNPANRDRPEQ